MNKIILSRLLILVLCFFSGESNAQDGYTYTLVDNGNFNYSVSVVPNASASNFATSVQSYGFTIILPNGITATVTSSLGNGAAATFFDGTNVGQPTIDGYLITETLGSPIGLPAPSSGIVSPIVTIQLNSTPTTGTISILANDSALASAITPLKCFMSADMIDDGMALFPPVVDAMASGLSGTVSYEFDTLSVPTTSISELSVYPNPAQDEVRILASNLILDRAEVYSVTGQRVMVIEDILDNRLDTSQLKSAVYLVKIYSDTGANKTFKLIKE
ncbi:T9SS type A sorting domain-containing protein [uncultured Psychroserpens sp.]|uniref:T9SS type A sorting domain-containing protein n=1 Tax=uncultured Psychroserpens sp. TaxID=255436 RepID=UPI00262294F5|nr:T9SS type A sorting domain-containing protein [uncultured Psychroserpens sp.]